MSPRKNVARKQSKTSSKNTRSKTASKKGASQGGSALSPAMKADIIGIIFIVVGLVLAVAVINPGNAPVTSALSTGVRFLFGLMAFILPFACIAWGITFFLKSQEKGNARVVVGILIIIICLMGLLSLFSGGLVKGDIATVTTQASTSEGGGIIGSFLAWCLLSTLGSVVAAIIFIGLIVVGLVLVGLSISTLVLFVKNFFAKEKRDEDDADFKPSVRKGKANALPDYDEDEYLPVADETIQLGNNKLRDMNADDDFGFDEPVDTGKTVKLPKGTRKGAKTVKRAKADKTAENSQETVELGAPQSATEGYELPDMGRLKVSGSNSKKAIGGEVKETAQLLQRTLEEFNLPARVVGWLAGPTVTMFKVELPTGVKLAKLTSLADDIALSLAASSVRIAQIPNTSLVGVEIPNRTRVDVLFGDIIPAAGKGTLQMAIGEDVDGNKVCVDLAKMPHLLIGGTTGSGKSVCINSMIMSLLMRTSPAEVRMILIDPKRIEFSQYNGIPHLYVPVVTEPKEAAAALRWGVLEMERRLKVFEKVGARNIGIYNKKIQDGELDEEDATRPDEMPYIVIVIDELSDLMMAAGKDVEDSIVRISQLARAAGIHLIVATQRPSSNVVTGMIKANITNRIALLVATGIDSRVILDQTGAEKLVGNGDMLFSKPDWGKPKRIQGCYVSDAEINEVVDHLKEQGTPDYHPEILQQQLSSGGSGGGNSATSFDDINDDDPLIWEAADAVVSAGLGSTSMLQRRLKVGYARAGRIMDMLENKGIVGPPDGSKAREVLIDTVEDLEAIKAFEASDKEGF